MFHVLTKRLQPQKKRSYRFVCLTPFFLPTVGLFCGWTQVLVQGAGLVSWHLVERIYIWGKKLVRYPRQRARFWVNLQCGLIFTRKPKNTRMGKGKGTQAGRVTRVSSGALLVAFSQIRRGYLRRLLRQVRVRCPLQLAIRSAVQVPCRPSWLRLKKTRRRYARLASARAWSKTRKFKRQRIFEFVTLTFFWLQKTPKLFSRSLLVDNMQSLVELRYQTAATHPFKLKLPLRWLWLNVTSFGFFFNGF